MPRPLKPVEACGWALLRMLPVFPASIYSSSVIEPFSVLGPWGTSLRRPARNGAAASRFSPPDSHNPNRRSRVMPSRLARRPVRYQRLKMLKSGRANTKQVRKLECYVCWARRKGMGGNFSTMSQVMETCNRERRDCLPPGVVDARINIIVG